MIAALREIETPEKSHLCRAYDFILQPLNIVLGVRKVISIDAKVWTKEARTTELALFVIAAVVTVVFAPLILAVLVLKAHNSEHRLRTVQYQVAKKSGFLLKQGYSFKEICRDDTSFAFKVQHKASTNPFWIQFSWYGKLRFKNLFEQPL